VVVIDKDTEAKILRLHLAEKWPPGTIARHLGVHHGVVRRVLEHVGVPAATLARRRSMADPYVGFIIETLEKYPELCASRVYEMVRERGYRGSGGHFRQVVRRLRPPKSAEAFLRLRTLPAEQAQVDWGSFGEVPVLGGKRPLVAFVMVLSWSRMVYLRFGLSQRMGAFLEGHDEAFAFFGGVPRVLLYDNLKSAVTQRVGDVIRFNDTLLAYASHQGYEPRPCAPFRGNEKGRVERAIRYIRASFFPARSWTDLDDLNRQARAWCLGISADRRCPGDRTRTVGNAFAEERERLRCVPETAFPAEDRQEVAVGKTPYARFDGNDYSLPDDRVRRAVTVFATSATVRILDGLDLVASHDRSWGRGQVIEDPAHVAALVASKRHAAEARGLDRLARAAPESRRLLRLTAEQGGNLGATTSLLLRVLDAFGAAAVNAAITEVVDAGRHSPHAVRQVLDRRRHELGLPAPVAVALPDRAAVRDVTVTPHRLDTYDTLTKENANDDDSD
jgi:transposase